MGSVSQLQGQSVSCGVSQSVAGSASQLWGQSVSCGVSQSVVGLDEPSTNDFDCCLAKQINSLNDEFEGIRYQKCIWLFKCQYF